VEQILPDTIAARWADLRPAIEGADLGRIEAAVHQLIQERDKIGAFVSPELATLLVREGTHSLNQGRTDVALLLGKTAQVFSPSHAPAYDLQARAILKTSKGRIPEALLLEFQGTWASLETFWVQFYLLGKIWLTVGVALLLTVFVYWSSLLFRVVGHYHHLLKELTPDLSPLVQSLLWVILFLLTLVFHPGWSVVIWSALGWVYLSQKERVMASTLILVLLATPFLLAPLPAFYQADRSPLLVSMVSSRDGDPMSALSSMTPLGSSGPQTGGEGVWKTVSARLYAQLQMEENAMAAYREALKSDPHSERALIGLGNLFYRREGLDQAIDYYRMTLEFHPQSPAAAYNLSQAYKEKLLFKEGKQSLQTALAMDQDRVQEWMDLAKRGPGYSVVDVPFTTKEIWGHAISYLKTGESELGDGLSQGLFGVSIQRLLYLAPIILSVLWALSFWKGGTPLPYPCPVCKDVVCGWCRGSRFFGKTCRECRAKEKAGVIDPFNEAGRGGWFESAMRWGIPGWTHLIQGKSGAGGGRLLLFTLSISGLLVPLLSHFPRAVSAGYPWDRVLWIVILIMLYIQLLNDHKIISIRFTKTT
jgi:tetratricopeptide (TPR) repeat protein